MRSLSPLQTPPQLPALRPFYAAIGNRDVEPARMFWWGDSVSEGSTLTDSKHAIIYRFQEMLRGAFPTLGVRGGRGYIPVYYASTSMTDEWTIDLSANLGGTSTAPEETQSGLGARGLQLKNGAAVTITQEFTDFDVHFSKNSFGVPFNVFVDGIQQGGSIATNNATIQGGWVQSYTGFAPGVHDVKIQTTDSAGFISVIHGATFFYGDKNKGIHIYDAAKNGAAAQTGTTASFGLEHYRTMATLQPHAVVVQLITNDAVFYQSPSDYYTDLLANFANINSLVSTPYTLIGLTVSEPNNSFVGGAAWASYLDAMQDALRDQSNPNAVFVDMSDFLGPKVATDTLGLWSDAVHLSRKGSSTAADRLLHALNLNGGGTTVPVSNVYQTLPFSKAGTLTVQPGKFPVYNDTGATWTLTAARADVGTAPTGAAIQVLVKVNGTTAITISIPSGSTTSGLVSPDPFIVPVGGKVTVDVSQIGSTTPGADLSVTVTTQSLV